MDFTPSDGLDNGEYTVEVIAIKDGKTATKTKPLTIVNKSELQANVDEAKALNESDYTPDSWEEMQDMLTAAQKVLDNPDATPEEVDSALTALTEAIGSLEKKAPKLVTAELDGDKLTLSFDQNVTVDGADGLIITVGGEPVTVTASNVMIDPDDATKVIVTLPDSPNGQTVLVSYDPSNGGLNGTNGVPVESFADVEAFDPFTRALTITQPTSGSTVTEPKPEITGTVEAGSYVTIVIRDSNGDEIKGAGGIAIVEDNGNWKFTPGIGLGDGEYTIEAIASSNDGKTAIKTTEIIVSISGPSLEITSPTSSIVPVPDLQFKGKTDPGATVKVTITDKKDPNKVIVVDADVDPEGNWSTANIILADGEYTVEVTALVDGKPTTTKTMDLEVKTSLTPSVDKSKLQQTANAIDIAQLEEDDYTPDSWANLQNELSKARDVLNDPNATQEQVDNAKLALENALHALEPAESDGVNKALLKVKEAEINLENLNGSIYTPESWGALQEALTKAREVLANDNATQEEVDAALSVLTSTRNNLTKRDTGGDNGGDNGGGDNGNNGGDYTWYPSTPASTPAPPKPIIDVTKNGNQDAFATGTEQKVGSETKTYVRIDKNKVSSILSQKNGQQLSVHVPNQGNVEATGLTAADVQKLADTGSSLQVSNLLAIYPVPGGQLNLNAIANNWNNAALGDIAVQIDIQLAPNGVIDRASKQASSKGYELLVDPVDLDLTFKHDGQTIRSGLLNGYAPKYIALPEGIDPNRITTGVIVNSDGTVFHVPTVVTKIDNRYFALINDLRSSGTYSVIWNPKDFDDVRNHWAQSKVNNVSARLDLAGTGNNTWSPDRNVDRAQFAAIVSYGMGIMRQDVPQNIFSDINASAWYYPSITIANEFGIVKGYGDDTFRGNQLIKREEGIAMIARAYKLVHPEAAITQAKTDNVLAVYGDASEVSAWARESLALMISAGIVEGKEGKLLKPQDYMTRAESVALLERLLKVTELIDK